MDLIETNTQYTPYMDMNGNYIDCIPNNNVLKNGIVCSCGTRKDLIVFYTNNSFAIHTKTKKHQEWLQHINNNKTNYYCENIKLNQTIKTQQILIAKMEKEIRTKSFTIDILTEQISNMNESHMEVDNLLDM